MLLCREELEAAQWRIVKLNLAYRPKPTDETGKEKKEDMEIGDKLETFKQQYMVNTV